MILWLALPSYVGVPSVSRANAKRKGPLPVKHGSYNVVKIALLRTNQQAVWEGIGEGVVRRSGVLRTTRSILEGEARDQPSPLEHRQTGSLDVLQITQTRRFASLPRA